ncbi:MAG: LAGLIDADG family homing endonuclease [Candidatus Omnitrophica bacterium]|nr:LAGLIDADG family homing endonuclease [Candidatus Omnitrophota bacterium]MDE2010389.1 LAGLIDADG family homing endonuclease [Candidatus Omnitrophota bacterium]MDE2214775.1 LAGLIDADG family homing endonuclease [Candidatus Omnitrophota bacterium]MDE2231442.1 LAGLIDADG family homing endonuclease [Candidatus Omnitrophota bacterium]
MDEVEKAYIAGIVDGEGTIGLWRHHRNETHTPNVTVANNSLTLLQWIKSKAGGGIVSKKKRQAHHNDSYAWSVRQDHAISFLNEIKRYLIIKRQQAELITGEYKAVTHRAGKYTPEMLMKKEALVAKIRKLNQRQMNVSYNTPGSLIAKIKGEEIVHAIQK